MKGNWKFMRTKLECKISLGYVAGLRVIFKMTKFLECILQECLHTLGTGQND